MKVHDVEQNSVDWQIIRSGKVTASEMDNLVTPLGKVKIGDGPRSYLMKKVAETWLGGPLPSLNIWDMEQGHLLEEYARPAFTLLAGDEVDKVGFITTDDGRCGCSPDGIIAGKEIGLEIKCPHIETHIRYLLDGVVPPDYVIQVQASLWVTGFKSWKFVSYRRKMPMLIVSVEPDAKIQAAINEAVGGFIEQFDKSMARLMEINGGPPQRPSIPKPIPDFRVSESDLTP